MTTTVLFCILDDHVILRSAKGVYKQAKVARRKEFVYACTGGGFVALYANGTTSNPGVRWEEIENGVMYQPGRLGRLMAPPEVAS